MSAAAAAVGLWTNAGVGATYPAKPVPGASYASGGLLLPKICIWELKGRSMKEILQLWLQRFSGDLFSSWKRILLHLCVCEHSVRGSCRSVLPLLS